MTLTIDGQAAVLPDDIAFDYITENPLFSDADEYTLAIDLPLAGTPANQNIFGIIHDPRVDLDRVYFHATLQTGGVIRQGIAVITDVSDESVSVQFLQGRSARNWQRATLDEIYLNEMELPGLARGGSFPVWTPEAACWSYAMQIEMSEQTAVRPDLNPTFPKEQLRWPMVALRWVNNSSGLLHNLFGTSPEGTEWRGNISISWMPYLLTLARAVAAECRFAADFSEWEASELRGLVCCNVLPWGMPVARALPHWTVKEFFENLEDLLGGVFDFDFYRERVVFRFSDPEPLLKRVVLDRVLDAHTREVTDDKSETAGYVNAMNVGYADRGDTPWKFESCRWFVEQNPPAASDIFESYEDFRATYSGWQWGITDNATRLAFLSNRVFYCRKEDIYIIIENRPVRVQADKEMVDHYVPRIINSFGEKRVVDDDDAETRELKIVPVCIDDAAGDCIFMNPAGFSESATDGETLQDDDGYRQSHSYLLIKQGDASEKSAYYDKLFVGWWPGSEWAWHEGRSVMAPYTDTITVDANWRLTESPSGFTMRLNREGKEKYSELPQIDPGVKYTFSFLTDTMPPVGALFVIQGRRYLCAKLTAEITADGISEMFKGEFYRVV